jgi:hypothetical protein
MSRLFSYCLRYDDGAAPNPFWGVCSLAICKPAIRRVAEVGDWIVGTGSATSPIGNIGGDVVYAMRVDEILTMAQYDAFTLAELPKKIPASSSNDPRRLVGDSIYDFSADHAGDPGELPGGSGPGTAVARAHTAELRRRLRELWWTQEALAKQSGFSEPTISTFTRDRSAGATTRRLIDEALTTRSK